MKKSNYIKALFIVMLFITFNGCKKDFLERVPEATYIASEFYQTPEELEVGVNPLYGGVWFDYYRSFIDIGDVMAGNYNRGIQNKFYTFSLDPSFDGLSAAYASLFMAVSYANVIKGNIERYTPETVDEKIKNKFLGEALVMKSMANFYLVRCFGDIPIIHDSQALISSGVDNVTVLKKIKMYDVYEYIIRSLKKAAELLPDPSESGAGRANRWSAYGLLAKVYLYRSGVDGNGSRNQSDLDSAAKYARIVVNEGPALDPNYADLFTISKGNYNPENLISLHWVISAQWGSQNAMQADLAAFDVTGSGDGWGAWTGPTIDLVSLFGESAIYPGPVNPTADNDRIATQMADENFDIEIDTRRKATIMLDGDFYPEIHRDVGGYAVHWDGSNKATQIQNSCGAIVRKHVVGNNADHQAEAGVSQEFMKTNLATHLLRVSDIYLVLAEAILGNNETTTNQEALDAFNAVRKRALVHEMTEISLDSIYDERRRELAFEGDNWFDYVRLSYYNPAKAKQMLMEQERGAYSGGDAHSDTPPTIESKHYAPANSDAFILPYPISEVLVNPNLGPDVEPIDMDWSTIEF